MQQAQQKVLDKHRNECVTTDLAGYWSVLAIVCSTDGNAYREHLPCIRAAQSAVGYTLTKSSCQQLLAAACGHTRALQMSLQSVRDE
eukprot:13524-Heterococcus_DN1.PRE.1